MKRIAISQSNYIPWKGYFDLINSVDLFILYDVAQYTVRDWRNRNKIKSAQGAVWLSIPVLCNSRDQKICETKVADRDWNKKHWGTIARCYKKAKFFQSYKEDFESLYAQCAEQNLSDINYKFIKLINRILDIRTPLLQLNQFERTGNPTQDLIKLCSLFQAGEYLTGPNARAYLDVEAFERNHIKVSWMDYNAYRAYSQLYPPFDHHVSVIDLIFNEGPNAKHYMKSFV